MASSSPSPSELSLDFKPHSYSMVLKSFRDQTDQTYKLEEFLSRLEEERLKIDAFKRELPLCMQLLTNAMEASRQQLQVLRVNEGTRPVLEEFIPIKQQSITSGSESSAEKETNICDNKANWMTSAQLWSQASELGTDHQQSPKDASDIGFSVQSPKLVVDNNNKQRNGTGGGAFVPFSKLERNSSCQGSALMRALPELALAASAEDKKLCVEVEKGGVACQKRENSGNDDQGKGGLEASHAQTTTTPTTTTTQTHRKARRCWSPDLHRRFVNALQMLGGSQVATPKQIRELMKVDGLTNDEVKSHLQKYRLHTRRPSPSPQTGAPAPQLVVLGGIWVPPEYATAAAGGPALYGAHPTSHAPPHYCAATSLPQEFYTTAPSQQLLPPPPPPHHSALHHHHHLMHVYETTPQSHGSPESDVRGGSESIEDGKSESSSWKGESGENQGDNNGSEITLKF